MVSNIKFYLRPLSIKTSPPLFEEFYILSAFANVLSSDEPLYCVRRSFDTWSLVLSATLITTCYGILVWLALLNSITSSSQTFLFYINSFSFLITSISHTFFIYINSFSLSYNRLSLLRILSVYTISGEVAFCLNSHLRFFNFSLTHKLRACSISYIFFWRTLSMSFPTLVKY